MRNKSHNQNLKVGSSRPFFLPHSLLMESRLHNSSGWICHLTSSCEYRSTGSSDNKKYFEKSIENIWWFRIKFLSLHHKPIETNAMTKFTQIALNEVMFDLKNTRFILAEKKQGVYSIGRAILLYQMDGTKKTFVKRVGWTQSDNHNSQFDNDSILNGIVDWESCKTAAIKYLQTILK